MEELIVVVSFSTAQAIENAIALAQHVRALRGEIDGLAGSVGTVDSKLATFGTTAQQANAPTATMGNTVHNASMQFNQLNQQFNSVQANATTYISNTTNITRKTEEATGATAGLVSQLGALAAGYLGFQTVIQLLDNFLERLEKIRQAQDQLAGGKLADDKDVVRKLMLSLTPGEDGPMAEQHARKMIEALTDIAPVTRSQASEALIVSASTGKDPGTKAGMDYAKAMALFMARRNVTGDTAMQMSKLTSELGMDSAQGLNQFAAEIDQAFKVSHSTNHQAFMTGLISALIPATQQGMGRQEAMSVFSGLLNVTGSGQAAGDAFKQILALASPSGSQKAQDFVAKHAMQMGMIHPDQMTDAQVESHLDNKAKLGLRKKREEIAKEEREIADAESQRSRKPLAPQQQRQHEEHLRNMQEKLDRDKEALKVEMDTLRLHEAAKGLTKTDRFHVVEQTFAGAKTSEEQNQLVSELGGLFRRTDSVFRLAGDAAQAKVSEAEKAIAGATAAQTEEGNISFAATDQAQKNAEEARKGKVASDVSPGQMRAHLILDEAITKTGLDTSQGKFAPSPDDDLSTWAGKWSKFSESQQLAPAAWDILGKQIEQFANDPNTQGDLASAAGQLQLSFQKERESMKNVSGASALQAINNLAQQLGNLQRDSANRQKAVRDAKARVAKTRPQNFAYGTLTDEQLAEAEQAENALNAASGGSNQAQIDLHEIHAEQKRRAAQRTAGPPAPATQPSGAHASTVHYHNTVHIGNHWAGGDDDVEFLGRHETA